ncbi:DNA (cytosine-5)-methyltransferase 1A-like [Amaranthus tricolor]|uniref:DNA (cytosine-5)-methyltransferase 1A-like n=1 Tax=Amaranthus tricolor TaxID=29722 RepID=UPI00258378F4|nr:DNA (cytosine-5)-methyltransferase 1A-like [Amaranthus tricolor]XP_057547561.1 DNA (cytosine-5)-methyltransferase 1A-like [Amaranthus tricolor]
MGTKKNASVEVVASNNAEANGPGTETLKGKKKKRDRNEANGENACAEVVPSSNAEANGPNTETLKGKKKKRDRNEANGENALGSRRMPKRAAACLDFKEKNVPLSEKDHLVDAKRVPTVESEIAAIGLTTGHDDPRPNRRLIDFIFHDEDGKAQPVEILEVTDLFITGVILPLEPSGDPSKDKGVRCEGFGRIETWDISGYEDGEPTIWISTDIGDYDCWKPAASYKKIYGLFYEKARACTEVYKKLSRSSGGNPDIALDELIALLVRSMSGSKNFPPGASIKEFIISRGEFIYNQLIGLDITSNKKDQKFSDLPVLVSLRDECKKNVAYAQDTAAPMNLATGGSLKIGDVEKKNNSDSSMLAAEEDEDAKLARLLQEEEEWRSMNQRKGRRQVANKYYVKINEDEIAIDYPLPAYYKPNSEETDEYIIFDNDMDVTDPDLLPRSMLHNWSLYNSDSRLVSLELLPMKPCDDIDVAIFGSGIVTDDDGSGFCLDADIQSSSASSEAQDVGGIPVYLSAIKEWMIEIGASMAFISIRTDMAWYRLGKPSKQYAPWYETVIKTARLATGIITLLKEQSRVARLSFSEIIKRVAEFDKTHPAFISSNPAMVEKYVVVHGQILLQQFAEYPDNSIRNSPFVSGLYDKMLTRHHTKWIVKKKAVTRRGANLNPVAKLVPIAKRKLMPATTTRLINRIWGEFYSKYAPEELKEEVVAEIKEEEILEEEEEQEEDVEEEQEEKVSVEKSNKKCRTSEKRKLSSSQDVKWEGEVIQKAGSSESLYKQANVFGESIAVGGCVLVETDESEELPPIYFVEYLYEKSGGKKMVHGRLLLRGSQTVLGNAANESEVFLTENCMDFELGGIQRSVHVEFFRVEWGYQHRKANAVKDKIDRSNAEKKSKGLPLEYYCKSFYQPDKGAFFCLPHNSMGDGNGICHACETRLTEKEHKSLKVNPSKTCFSYEGVEYNIGDFFYVGPRYFAEDEKESETFKSSRNVGLKPFVICQLLGIEPAKSSRKSDPESIKIKARRFFRPEDISAEKAYRSDVREVYFSEQTQLLSVAVVQGKCQVRRKHDMPSSNYPAFYEHVFFCEHLYDPDSGATKQLPGNVKLGSTDDESLSRKKGKGKQIEDDELIKSEDDTPKTQLATLDIFAGCGGLSEGLEQSGVSQTKWAIEYEEPAGEAFKLNHPGASVFINNCNVILSAIMSACGDEDDCISTSDALEEAKKLDDKAISDLPRPGQVDFINGGPPCQGFSGMNRFNKSAWSKVQCEMILAFLSFADYFRPKYFLLENVRNFVSFNKCQTFRLTLASLLEMGYQVRFGILEAGACGVSQSRKRAFIWAASPEEILPDWPEPMHVFAGSELKINLDGNTQYAAVRSTATGAPFRSITVRDTIGDLPAVENGASLATMEYKSEPISWFQKMIRRDMVTLTDHISKEMNELNLIRCQKIPKRPGADWRDLPDEKVKLSTGQLVDLVPWCLPNTAERHNQWKGLFGRLDWEGNFPTSITDPQPMGKVGMCFHPDQDRIVTVRECARSQGFPDNYKFAGNIQHRHRQIGNAVPPPLAFALGRKLKEAVEKKQCAS